MESFEPRKEIFYEKENKKSRAFQKVFGVS